MFFNRKDRYKINQLSSKMIELQESIHELSMNLSTLVKQDIPDMINITNGDELIRHNLLRAMLPYTNIKDDMKSIVDFINYNRYRIDKITSMNKPIHLNEIYIIDNYIDLALMKLQSMVNISSTQDISINLIMCESNKLLMSKVDNIDISNIIQTIKTSPNRGSLIIRPYDLDMVEIIDNESSHIVINNIDYTLSAFNLICGQK